MSSTSTVRVGIVLPHSHYGEGEWQNAERAIAYADEAAGLGAQLVLFPEGYPGPMTGPLNNPKFPFDPVEELKKKAKQHSMYIIAGNVIPSDVAGAHLLTLRLFGPEGTELARYLRQQPDTPPLNAYLYGGKAHLLPGKQRIVVDTDLGKIGLLICSEMWCPELPRMLMLRGAEIMVSPVHGRHSQTGLSLQDTWYCLARARAAENLCYVLSTQNLYVSSEDFDYRTQMSAGAIAAGPERMEGKRSEPGVLITDLDMERLRYLRTRNFDEENLSVPDPNFRPIGCRPGQIYERDPSLYKELTEPSPYSMNYEYGKGGNMNSWIDDYNKIYQGDYQRIQTKYGALRFKEHPTTDR